MSYKVVQIKSIQPPEIAVQLDTGEYVSVSCSLITVDQRSEGLVATANAIRITAAGDILDDANGAPVSASHTVHSMGYSGTDTKESIAKSAVLSVLGEKSDPGIQGAIKAAAQTGQPDLESIL